MINIEKSYLETRSPPSHSKMLSRISASSDDDHNDNDYVSQDETN
jgi:hypothetical protein